jgi:hypothetical protein
LVPPAEPFDRAGRLARGVPLPREAPWPRQSPHALDGAAIALPVPAQSVFEIQEKPRAAPQGLAPSSHHAEQTVPAGRETDGLARLISADAGDSRRMIPGSLPLVEPGLQRGPVGAR